MFIPYRPRPLLPVPTEDQVERLLAQPNVHTPLGVRDRALLETAYSTGCRVGELLGLRVRDVCLDTPVLRVLGKGPKERLVPVGKQALAWLSAYIHKARPFLVHPHSPEALWLTRTGQPVTQPLVGEFLFRYCRGARVPRFSIHALRRACATHMLRNGAHPIHIQQLLGHAGLGSLSQYLRVTITDLKYAHLKTKPGQ
jgi:integrase/recombinase XerD